MWKLEDLLQLKYPRKWQIQGIYSTVNGTTLDMYLKNMRNMLMEQLTESELIIINRCPEGVDRSGFRRALKVQNPMAQLIFEGMDARSFSRQLKTCHLILRKIQLKLKMKTLESGM